MGKHVGLPKVDRTQRNRPKKNEKSKGKSKSGNKQDKPAQFVLLNATRVNRVKYYFETISKDLYDKIFYKSKYYLYQNTGKDRKVFLVPLEMHNLVSSLRKKAVIDHCAIYLGFLKSKRDRTGYSERFYLSYEGGRFIYDLINKKYTDLLNDIQIIKLNNSGERMFLYGQNISLDKCISETEELTKRKLIFVINQQNEYLGLALLKVKMIGQQEYDAKTRYIEEYSRSGNFMLSILNLADAGYYLRGEGKK